MQLTYSDGHGSNLMANMLAAQRFSCYGLDLVYLRGSRGWEAELATESACDEVSRRTGVDEGCNWERFITGSKLDNRGERTHIGDLWLYGTHH